MMHKDFTNVSPEWRTLEKADAEIALHAWRLGQAHPVLNGRAYRAGLLAAGDAVVKVDDMTYTVKSQNGGGSTYIVRLNGQGVRWATCSCADFAHGCKGNTRGAPITRHESTPRCKHILAVAMSPAYKATVGGAS